MRRKQFISMLLLAAMLATVSCGGNASSGNDDSGDITTEPPVEAGYDFQGKNFNDYEFNVINLDYQWGSYISLDFAEDSSEMLDSEVWKRNRYIEGQLGFKLNEIILERGYEWQTGQEAICDAIYQQVMADGDEYDAGFLPVSFKPDLVTDSYLMNLADIPEMHVYDDYWDSSINEALTINGKLYTAGGPLNMMTTHTSWILVFNQNMMTDLGLDYPYQLVRDKKWTLDKLYEYTTAGANLNGDDTFTYTEGANAIYGIAAHTSVPAKMLFSADVDMYTRDSEGNFEFTYGGEKVYDALQKIMDATNIVNGNGTFENYNTNFSIGRCMLLGCELKDVQWFREVEEFSFGILPYPLYDEKQEDYRTSMGETSVFLVIPSTQDDPARAGLILDALTYESKESVLPVFYDVTLSQKNLRDEESLEMLEIIWESREINVLSFYGVDKLSDKLGKLISSSFNITSAASTIESDKSSMEQKLLELMEKMAS